MPKGRKRTPEEYEREIEEASKRIRKNKENIKSARDDDTWQDYLLNVFGASPQSVNAGQDFWDSVKERTLQFDREVARRSSYSKLRQASVPAKLARQVRDWSRERQEFIIGQYKNS